MDPDDIRELISRRRRQLIVHSIIYYRLNENLISDYQWSQWAVELDRLQRQYPEVANQCYYAKEFKDFDPSTGYNLPLGDPHLTFFGIEVIALSQTVARLVRNIFKALYGRSDSMLFQKESSMDAPF